ncbi:MAG: metal ABC transporter permease [Acidobacteria bacterium]|nr:metal ABC transporter permease [Acidobacteriota bacterium]
MELTYTLRNVLAGATLLGIVGGVLGCFAVLRRQSLLGDALAHAALPGVCVAFLLTGSKSPPVLLLGALAAGLAGGLAVLAVVRATRIKEDSALGVVLSVFFGLGIVLLTYIQKLPLGNQSGLDKFLFGQAATLMPADVRTMAVLGALALASVAAGYKEMKLVTFDRGFATSLGLPVRAVELALTLLLVVAVVVGLQTVGVVLMVATLVTPAAAARQWTERLGSMLLLAALIGATAGASGALASASAPRLPTGPVIVLVSSAVLVVSLLLAPRRGLIWGALRERSAAWRIRRENLLKDLYRFGEAAGGQHSWVTWPALMGLRGQSGPQLQRLARRAARAGLVEIDGDALRLAPRGLAEAERIIRKHRLWEVYLARRLELPLDHVHRDAEAMEHALSDAAVEDIERLLGYPQVDPHGRNIPRRRNA